MDENGERISVLGILLSVLKVLVAENQPYRDFNLSQLRDIDALDKILFMCKVGMIERTILSCFIYLCMFFSIFEKGRYMNAK